MPLGPLWGGGEGSDEELEQKPTQPRSHQREGSDAYAPEMWSLLRSGIGENLPAEQGIPDSDAKVIEDTTIGEDFPAEQGIPDSDALVIE